jgi:hypothetical protein
LMTRFFAEFTVSLFAEPALRFFASLGFTSRGSFAATC